MNDHERAAALATSVIWLAAASTTLAQEVEPVTLKELPIETIRAELFGARAERPVIQLQGREDALATELCGLIGVEAISRSRSSPRRLRRSRSNRREISQLELWRTTGQLGREFP